MSHFTRVKTKIKDEDMLLACLKEMGYSVEVGGSIRGYQGVRQVSVRVNVEHGYDIGFVRGADGCYEVLADWWGVSGTNQASFIGELQQRFEALQERVRRQLEEFQQRVRREYALKTSLASLQRQGFQVVDQREESDGTIKILARRWR